MKGWVASHRERGGRKGQSNKRAARSIKSERAIWLRAEKADSISVREKKRGREMAAEQEKLGLTSTWTLLSKPDLR